MQIEVTYLYMGTNANGTDVYIMYPKDQEGKLDPDMFYNHDPLYSTAERLYTEQECEEDAIEAYIFAHEYR